MFHPNQYCWIIPSLWWWNSNVGSFSTVRRRTDEPTSGNRWFITQVRWLHISPIHHKRKIGKLLYQWGFLSHGGSQNHPSSWNIVLLQQPWWLGNSLFCKPLFATIPRFEGTFNHQFALQKLWLLMQLHQPQRQQPLLVIVHCCVMDCVLTSATPGTPNVAKVAVRLGKLLYHLLRSRGSRCKSSPTWDSLLST